MLVKQWLFAVISIACLCFLAANQICATSATYDEPSYIVAGYTYLAGHDYRLFAPPVAPKAAAAPLMVVPLMNKSLRPDSIFRGGSQAAAYAANSWADLLGDPLSAPQYALAHLFLFAVRDQALNRLHVKRLIDLPTTAHLQPTDFINDGDTMLRTARIAMLGFAVILALIVFLWSSELWGAAGAIISLAFYCFNPNIIANAGLATTDLPLACFYCATAYFMWRLSKRFTPVNLAAACLAFGLAQATKHSALLLVAVVFLLLLMRTFSNSRWLCRHANCDLKSTKARALACAKIFCALLVSAWLCIWWQYDFRYSVTPDTAKAISQMVSVHPEFATAPLGTPGHLPLEFELRVGEAVSSAKKHFPTGNVDLTKIPLSSSALLEDATIMNNMPEHPHSWTGKLLLAANNVHILPEAYTFGFKLIQDQMLLRQSFLCGKVSCNGFPGYFAYAFIWKNPLVLIISLMVSVIGLIRIAKQRSFDLACLLLPAAAYAIAACCTNFNIGIRHILPIFPLLFVYLGSLATLELPAFLQPTLMKVFVLTIAVSSSVVLSPLRKPQIVFPDYITYFNELVGGPSNGWHYLADSNVDWGQGLKPLAKWLRDNQIAEPIYLCYFGQADPGYEGIAYRQVVVGVNAKQDIDSFDKVPASSYFATSVQNMDVGTNARFRQALRDFVNKRCVFLALVDNSILVYKVSK